MSVFGLFIAVFIGIGLVSKEVERRSIYRLLSKPIHRHQFVVGKYAGLVLTLAVNLAVMAAALYARARLHGVGRAARHAAARWDAPALDPALLKAVVLIFVELMVVTAIALFFSTFSTPMLSAALTVRRSTSPATSAPTCGISTRSSTRGGGAAGARALLGAAEPRAVRRQGAGRPRAAGAARLRGADDRLRRGLHRACCWRLPR